MALKPSISGRAIRFCKRLRSQNFSSFAPFQISLGEDVAVKLAIQQQFTAPPGAGDTTGRRVWPTAIPLLKELLLLNSRNNQKRPSVIELGAGCGLLGMGMALSNQFRRVVLTDVTTEWLEHNVARNEQLIDRNCFEIRALRWGDHQSLRDGDQVFDWIVGSDILYDPSSHAALATTLRGLTGSTSTEIFIAYPNRQQDEEHFLSHLAGEFEVEITPLTVESTSKAHSLMHLSRKEL